jgi:hypothetical protein
MASSTEIHVPRSTHARKAISVFFQGPFVILVDPFVEVGLHIEIYMSASTIDATTKYLAFPLEGTRGLQKVVPELFRSYLFGYVEFKQAVLRRFRVIGINRIEEIEVEGKSRVV